MAAASDVSQSDRITRQAAPQAGELIKALYDGYVFATPEQFAELLDNGTFQIWKAGNIYALIEFVETSYGKTLNVLTVTGSKEDFDIGIAALEPIARMNGAKLIYSVGHLGWEKGMQKHGYTTERVLRMKKVLT
jgi:hypothetical protein